MPRVGLGRGQLRVRGPRSEHLHKRAGKLVEVYLFASYASPKVHGRVQISNLGIGPLGIYNSSGLAKRARFVIASSGVYDDPLVLGRPEAFRGNSIRVGVYEGIKHHAESIVIAYRRYPDISRTGEYLDGKSHFGVRDGSSKILERSVLRANRPGKVSPAQG